MAASMDDALDLPPETVRNILELIKNPPAPNPDLIRILRREPAKREVK